MDKGDTIRTRASQVRFPTSAHLLRSCSWSSGVYVESKSLFLTPPIPERLDFFFSSQNYLNTSHPPNRAQDTTTEPKQEQQSLWLHVEDHPGLCTQLFSIFLDAASPACTRRKARVPVLKEEGRVGEEEGRGGAQRAEPGRQALETSLAEIIAEARPANHSSWQPAGTRTSLGTKVTHTERDTHTRTHTHTHSSGCKPQERSTLEACGNAGALHARCKSHEINTNELSLSGTTRNQARTTFEACTLRTCGVWSAGLPTSASPGVPSLVVPSVFSSRFVPKRKKRRFFVERGVIFLRSYRHRP